MICEYSYFGIIIYSLIFQQIEDFPLSFVNLPVMKKKEVKGTFRFITPEKIITIGSFELKTTCSAKLPYVMDMAVEIPKVIVFHFLEKFCGFHFSFINEQDTASFL